MRLLALSIERDVSAGKTVTVQFTPQKPGRYSFYCDKKLLFLPSHREKGMEGFPSKSDKQVEPSTQPSSTNFFTSFSKQVSRSFYLTLNVLPSDAR